MRSALFVYANGKTEMRHDVGGARWHLLGGTLRDPEYVFTMGYARSTPPSDEPGDTFLVYLQRSLEEYKHGWTSGV